MPLKRRADKIRNFTITDEARAIFRSARGELICLTSDDAGLICHEPLAAALNLPAFIVMPQMATLAKELSKP